jgi:hypothetical protein
MTDRLSVGLDSMAADCLLHTDQAAQRSGRLYVAREMWRTIVLHLDLPQPRDQYYMAEAHRVLGASARSG